MRRSAMPVSAAPRRAISWRAAFLLPTRSWAITPRGTSRSAISITSAPPTPCCSSALARECPGPSTATTRLERRIDPPDIAVATAVNEVEPAMRPVAKQQYGGIGQIHPHHRFADGQLRQFGAHLGNHDRGLAVGRALGGSVLVDRGENKRPRRLQTLGRHMRLAMVVAQPA